MTTHTLHGVDKMHGVNKVGDRCRFRNLETQVIRRHIASLQKISHIVAKRVIPQRLSGQIDGENLAFPPVPFCGQGMQ